MPLAGNAIL